LYFATTHSKPLAEHFFRYNPSNFESAIIFPASAGSRDLLCKWLKELAVKVIADALFDLAALNQTAGSIRLSQELSAGSQHGIRHTAD